MRFNELAKCFVGRHDFNFPSAKLVHPMLLGTNNGDEVLHALAVVEPAAHDKKPLLGSRIGRNVRKESIWGTSAFTFVLRSSQFGVYPSVKFIAITTTDVK